MFNLVSVPLSFSPQLKSPHMITNIGTRKEASIGQINEIAIDRCSIEAVIG